jgi:hypothetical protein
MRVAEAMTMRGEGREPRAMGREWDRFAAENAFFS